MKKKTCLCLAILMLCIAANAAFGESLFVDNRETDKVYPERLNLRDEPSQNGGIIGLYYTGAEVEDLGTENETYTKVQIGGMTGYMASEYLISREEALARYGADSGFGSCRKAEIDLSGMWLEELPILAETDAQANRLAVVGSGTQVQLIGILDTWAYIACEVNDAKVYGYVPLDVLTDIGEMKVSIIAGSKADSKTVLYDLPNSKGKPTMSLKNGTACYSLFGRKEGEWRRVRVGGVSGWIKYTQTSSLFPLGDQERTVVPYYPLQMQTKGDALLYQNPDGSGAYMTIGRDMKVEVLAECEEMVYIRTLEGGAGAYDCGDYGYMPLSSLKLIESTSSVGVAQVDDGDLPLILYDAPDSEAEVLGALCGGAQVHILDYTQTDYVKIALGDVKAYVLKNGIRILTGSGTDASDRIPQRAVLLEDASLSSAPSAAAKQGERVDKGSRVYMLGVMGNWALVRAAQQPGLDPASEDEDHTGFLPLSALNTPESTTHLTAFVTKDKVNLRNKDSSVEGQIIGRARLGERLRIADYGKEWSIVVTPDGTRGYIMTEYLEFE